MEDIYDLSNKTFNRRTWREFGLLFLALILCILYSVWEITTILNGTGHFQSEIGEFRNFRRSIILLILGLVLIVLALWMWRLRGRLRKQLFSTYPELNNELANLLEADYIDEDLQILVYGHHLVWVTCLGLVDLDCCHSLETVVKPRTHFKDQLVYSLKATLDDGKITTFDFFNINYEDIDIDERLEELYDYINTNF